MESVIPQQHWNLWRVGEEPLRVISAERQKESHTSVYQLQLEARAEPVCRSVRCGRGWCRAFQNHIVAQTGMFSDWPFCRQASKFIPKRPIVAIAEERGTRHMPASEIHFLKKWLWGMIFSALSYYYNVWIDHHELFSCIFRNHWREKAITLNDWNDMKLFKIGERILTPTKYWNTEEGEI